MAEFHLSGLGFEFLRNHNRNVSFASAHFRFLPHIKYVIWLTGKGLSDFASYPEKKAEVERVSCSTQYSDLQTLKCPRDEIIAFVRVKFISD